MSIQNIGQRLTPQFYESIGKQLKLPVGFNMEGSVVNLEEVLTSNAEAQLWPELPDEKRAEITARRIELQPKFNLGLIGTGIIGKEQAIEEVRKQSRIGLRLIEIEDRLLTQLIHDIEQQVSRNKATR